MSQVHFIFQHSYCQEVGSSTSQVTSCLQDAAAILECHVRTWTTERKKQDCLLPYDCCNSRTNVSGQHLENFPLKVIVQSSILNPQIDQSQGKQEHDDWFIPMVSQTFWWWFTIKICLYVKAQYMGIHNC